MVTGDSSLEMPMPRASTPLSQRTAPEPRAAGVLAAWSCLLVFGCVVPEVPFEGKLCGPNEQCPEPYQCLYVAGQPEGVCLIEERGVPSAVPVPYLAEDFEAGLLTTDLPTAGAWTLVVGPGEDQLLLNVEAAHRGDAGLRHVDASSGPDGGAGLAIRQAFDAATPDVHARAWIRTTPAQRVGALSILQLTASVANEAALASVGFDFSAGVLEVSGVDAQGTTTRERTGASIPTGTWQLLELALTGLGTLNGSRAVWLDGEPVSLRSAIDLRGLSADEILLGQPSTQDGAFVGIVDFDDVRVSAAPLPAMLHVDLPAQAQSGACAAAGIQLRSSTTSLPARTEAHITVPLTVSSGRADLFLDEACQHPTTSIDIPAGFAGVTVFWRAPGAGRVQLDATHTDLLPGRSEVTVVSSEVSVGCTVTQRSLPANLALLSTALRALWRRRRR